MSRFFLFFICCLLLACGENESTPRDEITDTSSISVDTHSSDTSTDTPSSDTSVETSSADTADALDPHPCQDTCVLTTLEANFGDTVEPLEHAVYGVTSPERSSSGLWEVYIEVYGGAAGCPSTDSPTPDRTLILSGITLPFEEGTSQNKESGLRGNLLDFQGTLIPTPLASAQNLTLTLEMSALCLEECRLLPSPRDPDGFIALDANLIFEQGSLEGHLFATHCDSLDDL